MQVSAHAPGKFCWVDLTTTDEAAAKAFYGEIFGWSSFDSPISPDDHYTMFNIGGAFTAGMYEDTSGARPTCWTSYICVTDAGETTARIKELGGTVLAEPFEVMTSGTMAVAADPTGAFISLWQPNQHPGFGLIDEVGAVCWTELNTRDTDAATAFYSGVFGYTVKKSEHPMAYFEFQQDSKSIAGMMEMTPEMEGVPPHWLIYFATANCADSVEKAKSLGANVLFGPMSIETVGDIAVIMDPQGAVFGIIGP